MKIRENTDTENTFLCKLTKQLFPTTQQISLINISKTVETSQKMAHHNQPTTTPDNKEFSQRKFHQRKSRQKIKESSADKYAQMQKVHKICTFAHPHHPHEMPLSAHHTPPSCLRPFYNRNPSPPIVPCHAPPPTSPTPHMPYSPSL